MKICPVYRKAHYYLQVGTKHVVSTEIQIFNCKDGRVWFGDQELSIVVGNLQGELMSRIDRTENDMEVQIIEGDTLLMVYKFRHNNTKDSIILHRDQMKSLGLAAKVPNYGDGDYTYLILFQEKLIISVSLIEDSEELLNLTEANLDVEQPGSNYFENMKRITASEKRKKNTLKKIWNTRNRLKLCGKALPITEVTHKHIDEEEEVIDNMKVEAGDTPTSQDVISTFKEKISVFENGKSKKDSESGKEVLDPLKSNSDLKKSTDRNTFEQNSDPNRNEKGVRISRRVKRYSSSGSIVSSSQPNSGNKVRDCQDKNISIIEISHILPGGDEKPGDPITKKHGNATEIEEQFSDDDDFSSTKIKKRTRKNTVSKAEKRKKKKCNPPTCENAEFQGSIESLDRVNCLVEKPIENLAEDIEMSNIDKKTPGIKDVTAEGMSMEDLIRNKVDTDPVQHLDDIPTLIAENTTINLDDYGNVSLDNVESVDELSAEQVRDLVRDMEDDLRKIFKGERKCERHDFFKSGGIQKGSLNMRVAFGLFSEKQEESITSTLMEMFCTRRSKYFDYTMKVLLPETMAMLYAKVAKISYEEAEKLIMERC